jgi:hypothetical protein
MFIQVKKLWFVVYVQKFFIVLMGGGKKQYDCDKCKKKFSNKMILANIEPCHREALRL